MPPGFAAIRNFIDLMSDLNFTITGEPGKPSFGCNSGVDFRSLTRLLTPTANSLSSQSTVLVSITVFGCWYCVAALYAG